MLDGWPLSTYVSHKSTKNRAGTSNDKSSFLLLDYVANDKCHFGSEVRFCVGSYIPYTIYGSMPLALFYL